MKSGWKTGWGSLFGTAANNPERKPPSSARGRIRRSPDRPTRLRTLWADVYAQSPAAIMGLCRPVFVARADFDKLLTSTGKAKRIGRDF